jgi:hypothetical protein
MFQKTLNNKNGYHGNTIKILPLGKISKRLTKLFNFHSWQPEISESEYSVSLLGENVLSTLYSQLYYTYNLNEKNSNKVGPRQGMVAGIYSLT